MTGFIGSLFAVRGCQANNADLFRNDNKQFCPEGFRRAIRKALWWGAGAKPHIRTMLRHWFLKAFG